MGYLYISITILLTVYGQLVLKWRLNQVEELPADFVERIVFLVGLLFDPYIFSSFFSAFVASLSWMAALKFFDLSKAYPFMSLSYVCVLFLSLWLFNESFSYAKVIGSLMIVGGIIIVSKG